MIVVGLTGSIAMGKSTAASMLQCMGVPVHDADAAVHRLLGRGGAAVEAVAARFPGTEHDGSIDRRDLGQRVFGDAAALASLEGILHPLVRDDAAAFLKRCRRRGNPVAVLDVPLLFEVDRAADCDRVVVVSAPAFVQRQRALARPNMTPQRFEAIRRRQVPDFEKRRRADRVIPTGLGRGVTRRALSRYIRSLLRRRRDA